MKDPLLQSYTLEDLAVEFLSYAIEADPMAAFPKIKTGEVIRIITGDEWFDSLDEKVAKGENIDIKDLVAASDLHKLSPKNKRPTLSLPPSIFKDRY